MTVAAFDVVCHHHRSRMAPLLARTVLPALRTLAGSGLHVHVERHWLHGPHIRIRIAGGRAEQAAAELAGTLRRLPGTVSAPAQHSVEELLRSSVVAGRAELVPGPYEPIHPHGSVRVEPADDSRIAGLLGPAALLVRQRLLAAGLELLDTVTAQQTGGDAGWDDTGWDDTGWDDAGSGDTDARVRIALAAVAAHAAQYPSGAFDGHHTFVSHAEDFLHLHDPDGRIRRRFAAQWNRHGDRVSAEVARTFAGETTDPVARAVQRWSTVAWRECLPAAERAELTLRPGEVYRRRARGFDRATATRWDPAARSYSEYHRRLRRVDYTAGRETEVAAYRFATNVLYQLLLICDVTALERVFAAFLLSEATQRVTGRRWRDHLPPISGAPSARRSPASGSTAPVDPSLHD